VTPTATAGSLLSLVERHRFDDHICDRDAVVLVHVPQRQIDHAARSTMTAEITDHLLDPRKRLLDIACPPQPLTRGRCREARRWLASTAVLAACAI